MEDMFKDAQFGDRYRTREGWYAVYYGRCTHTYGGESTLCHELHYRGMDNKYCVTSLLCDDNGMSVYSHKKKESPHDIIGRW